jgi:hypothetical protein
MSVFQNNLLMGAASQGAASVYEIEQSARFNDDDSPFLIDPNSNAGDSRKTFTFSGWFKLGNLGINRYVYSYRYDASNDAQFYFNTSDQIELFDRTGGSAQMQLKTNRVFRDVSSWYHVLIIWDTTQSTASDRTQLYINGQRETSFATETYPSLNADSGGANRTGANMRIGTYSASGSYFDGYMAELHFFDDESLSPSSFGETNNNGIWIPKEYQGADSTYGSNGFYFQFANASALGANTKGKGNYTASGLSSADQMADTPTNNHAVFNILDTSFTGPTMTISDGNLKCLCTGTVGPTQRFSTLVIPPTGKWYFEFELDAQTGPQDTNLRLGVMRADINAAFSDANTGVNLTADTRQYHLQIGPAARTGSGGGVTIASMLGGFSAGDRMNIAINGANMWWGKNGTYYNSGNPATGSNASFTNLSLTHGGYRANIHWSNGTDNKSATVIGYFGGDKSIGSGTGFNDTVPESFLALNTTNLGS